MGSESSKVLTTIGGIESVGFVHNRGLLGVARVQSGQSAVFTKFGRVTRTVGPGIWFYIPFVHRVSAVRLAAEVLKSQVDTFSSAQQPMRIDARIAARPNPDMLTEFLSKNTDPTGYTVAAVNQALIRQIRTCEDIDDVLHRLPDLAQHAAESVREKLRGSGVLVDDVIIDEVVVPKNVREAMAGVVAAQRERDARKCRTDGEVYERVSLAKAKAEEDAIRARGISDARSAVAGGLFEAAEKLQDTGIDCKFLMEWIYRQDALRVREKFAHEKTTVFMSDGVDPTVRAAIVHANLLKAAE